MCHKYQLNTDQEIGRPGVRGHAYSKIENFERLSCAVFVTESRYGRIKNIASDRLYLLLEGEGTFSVGAERFEVAANNVVIVPRNTPDDYAAAPGSRLKLFLVHAPANIAEADIALAEAPRPERPPQAPASAV